MEVIQVATADFTADDVICLGETATITYTGTGTTGATYNWDFGSGTIISGSGAGPYEISWANGGPQNVSLIVDENGCTSELENVVVQVDEPLSLPQVICNTTTTQIDFSWPDVPGATGYEVNVISEFKLKFLSRCLKFCSSDTNLFTSLLSVKSLFL